MQSLPFGTEQSAITLRWYQEEAANALWAGMRTESPCVVLPTGCHESGHPILMADGTVRPVESITVGESVMGPDSLPRTVLALCRGVGEMFRITPVKGEPFVVNGDHILYLTCTSEGSKQVKPCPSHKHGGEVDCISVYDYLKKSKSWKHLRKLKYTDAITVPANPRSDSLFFNEEREIPPYIVGLMLGDGYMDKHIALCTADSECVEEFTKFAARYGWGIHRQTKPNNKASSYRIQSHTRGKTCTAREMFARAGLLGKIGEKKAVPSSYLLSSIEDRRELLAGLIDSDGHNDGHGGFDFINKSETLSRQVVFATRSIGLRSTIRESWKASQVSEKAKYWRVHVSGHTNAIPCRLERKQTKPREQIKRSQVTGFTVEKLPVHQPFFGFTLSDDHLYVDGNFLIHHNSGKSLVIAAVLRKVIEHNGRAMVLQPSKELIQQNADECCALMPGVDIGLYSAGLGKRHTEHDIVFAGIQSCYDKAHLFGRRDVILCDESHLLPPDGEGRFRTFFKGMKDLCPHLRIGGLTATPFRTGSGALCGPDNLLTKVVFSASVSRLMEEGYLCKIVNRPMQSELDTSGLKIVSRTHEFDASQAESLFDQDDNVNAAVDEIIEKAAGRRSILVFCSGVKHAEHVADRLASVSGEDVGLVTGGTLAIERANTIQRFKNGQLRWLVNVDVLTTGFNAKAVDCICMLRATASPGLFAQIVGRGFRVHPAKQDCLVCDFGENVKRHGPIDSPDYGIPPEKPKKETGAGMPSKECPACFEAIPISATKCPECGFEYPPKPKHEANADTESAILQSQVEPTIYVVESASFHRHEKKNAPDAPNTLRVDYVCQLADGGGNLTRQVISEWICLDHTGFARRNADKWWRERSNAVLAEDLNESRIDSAIDWWNRGAVAIAHTIWVIPQGRFKKIIKQELDDIPETWADEQEAVAFAYDASGFDAVGSKFGAEVPF